MALPFLAILYWIYLALPKALLLQDSQATLINISRQWLFEARHIWQILVSDGRWKQQALVAGPPLAILIFYMIYRVLVLPTGLVSARYNASISPLRGFASAVFWTFKAVPWEVPSWMLPAMVVAIGLALVLHPRSAGWRIVLLGIGWIAIGCLPLAYLGQVEPRLLYLPEVGHALVVTGLAIILGGFRRSALANRQSWQLLSAGLALVVTLAFFAATAFSQLKAQDEFQPLGYKMLRADYEVYSDLRYRHLYPDYYIKQIELELRQAGKIP